MNNELMEIINKKGKYYKALKTNKTDENTSSSRKQSNLLNKNKRKRTIMKKK